MYAQKKKKKKKKKSDLVKVWKCGSKFRADITLLDFVNLRCKRGDVSFVFDSNPDGKSDSKHKLFKKIFLQC